ncbi:MAG: histidine kinase [Propionicimonas sp.]
MKKSGNRLGRMLQNAVRRGSLEPVMVGFFAVLVVLGNLASPAHQLPAFLLDVVALAVAALTGRWPRAAGAALAVVLIAYMVFDDWPTLGEYVPLIVLLGYGVRGRRVERAWFSGIYLVELWVISWRGSPAGVDPLPYLIVWAIFVGVAWLAGSAWHGLIVAAEESRQLAALEERHELARELHDSVADALSSVSLRAQQAKLNGSAGPEELDAIADDAARAVAEFGQIVNVLRRDSGETASAQAVALEQLIDRAVERLRGRGFTPKLTWEGERPVLPGQVAHVLGRVIDEATNNMVRHGDPAAEAAIVVDVSAGLIELAFLDHPRRRRVRAAHETGFGLTSMRERVTSLGGSFTSEQVGESWLTSVQVPLIGAVAVS